MAPQDRALSSSRVVEVAVQALGIETHGEATVKSPCEAVALIGHSCMISVGFRLIGLGEEGCVVSLDPSANVTILPKEWNAQSTSTFRYAHSQSSMEYLLKLNRLGNNVVVQALAIGDDRTTTFDLLAKDYISLSALPLTVSKDNIQAFRDTFISTSRLEDLISLFQINVIQKLAPGIYKEGYDATDREDSERRRTVDRPRHDPLRDDSQPIPARPYPFDDPLALPPRRPIPLGDFPPPGFEDEYEINRPPRGYPPYFGGFNPPGFGDRDLYPPGLGPRDPLRGTLGPSRGGGMHPTFDDPLFAGQGGQRGYDPQIPPGARYDPVGPGDGRTYGPDRGRPGWGGGFGGPRGGFGGDII